MVCYSAKGMRKHLVKQRKSICSGSAHKMSRHAVAMKLRKLSGDKKYYKVCKKGKRSSKKKKSSRKLASVAGMMPPSYYLNYKKKKTPLGKSKISIPAAFRA